MKSVAVCIHYGRTVSEAYDFTSSGSGLYVIAIKDTSMLHHLADGNIVHIPATYGTASHTLKLSGALFANNREVDEPDEEVCFEWQKLIIEDAIPIANEYALNALELVGYSCLQTKQN